MPDQKAIPVLDISPLLPESAGDTAQLERLSKAINDACRGVGFFYCTGHGLSTEQIEQAVGAVRGLFNLDVQAKLAMNSLNSPLRRGYTPQGGQHNCNPSECASYHQADAKESYVLGAGPDMPKPPPTTSRQPQEASTHCEQQQNEPAAACQHGQHEGEAQSPMHGPNQLPPDTLLPGFKGTMSGYWKHLLRVSHALAFGLAKSLELPDDFFVQKMQDPVAQMLCVRYNLSTPPPAEQGSKQDNNKLLGCGTHTDCGFMTILYADGEGLEVCTPQGEWIMAPVIPGALLVNLGDMAAMWTAGRYRSTPHRVVLPHVSGTTHAASRVSLVFFCNCDFYAPVSAIDGSTNGQESTTAGRYMLEKLGIMYQ